MAHDLSNFQSSFWAIFCLFNPPSLLTAQKNEQSEKTLEITSFFTLAPKMIIGYTDPEIWHVTNVIVLFHFGLFFALSPP